MHAVENGTIDKPETRAGTAHRRAPTPRLRLPLSTLEHCRRELARLYRSAKAGEIAPQDATRLAYLLHLLARMLEVGELERRIAQLEDETREANAWRRH